MIFPENKIVECNILYTNLQYALPNEEGTKRVYPNNIFESDAYESEIAVMKDIEDYLEAGFKLISVVPINGYFCASSGVEEAATVGLKYILLNKKYA